MTVDMKLLGKGGALAELWARVNWTVGGVLFVFVYLYWVDVAFVVRRLRGFCMLCGTQCVATALAAQVACVVPGNKAPDKQLLTLVCVPCCVTAVACKTPRSCHGEQDTAMAVCRELFVLPLGAVKS
jgi:hypothetical protein